MKKFVFAVAVVAAMVFCTDASAQRYNSARVGLMGGFTSSSTSIKNMDSKSVSLYHVGLTAEIPLLGGFAIQPALLYQVKGMSADKFNSSSISESLGSFETKVGYLEVPVQVQWVWIFWLSALMSSRSLSWASASDRVPKARPPTSSRTILRKSSTVLVLEHEWMSGGFSFLSSISGTLERSMTRMAMSARSATQ